MPASDKVYDLRSAKKIIARTSTNVNCLAPSHISIQAQCLATLSKQLEPQNSLRCLNKGTDILSTSLNKLLTPQPQLPIVPYRNVTKFSLRKGKRKSVKTVLYRFFRLHWGIWIRTRAGRKRHLWKKSSSRKRRLRQHVFTNSTQSWMLDKMVTKFWKRPKYYIDDPYEPYHSREEFMFSQRKPKPLPE